MSAINPRLRKGIVREDGKVFYGYGKAYKNGEYRCSRERYEEIEKAARDRYSAIRVIPKSERTFKQGDIRESDGKVFWSYNRQAKNGEYWVAPEVFKAKRERQAAKDKEAYRANITFHAARNREWRTKNTVANRSRVKLWRSVNLEKISVHKARRRSRQSIDGIALTDVELSQIRDFYRDAKHVTEVTGIPHQVDHIVPLARGGMHHPNNLQILPKEENLRKHTKMLHELPTDLQQLLAA